MRTPSPRDQRSSPALRWDSTPRALRSPACTKERPTTYEVVARDAAGNATSSEPVSVTVVGQPQSAGRTKERLPRLTRPWLEPDQTGRLTTRRPQASERPSRPSDHGPDLSVPLERRSGHECGYQAPSHAGFADPVEAMSDHPGFFGFVTASDPSIAGVIGSKRMGDERSIGARDGSGQPRGERSRDEARQQHSVVGAVR
jgi:hypothetical protein